MLFISDRDSPVNGHRYVNGDHMEIDSDGDEFCDTSDLPHVRIYSY